MSNFKDKKRKVVSVNIKTINTLENKHISYVTKINSDKDNVTFYKEELIELNNELSEINILRENGKNIDLEKRAYLLNRIEYLSNEIDEIQSNNREMNYYDLTGDLLTKYYDIRHNEPQQPSGEISLMALLGGGSKKTTNNNNKTELFKEYCQRVEGVRVEREDGSDRIKCCNVCKIEMIIDLDSSSYVCDKCGLSEYMVMDEDVIIKEYSPYERINHFKDWLKQLQAKESIDISDDIFQQIVYELNKNTYYKNKKNINRKIIQKILKKIGHSKLYKHIPFIVNKISGIPPPIIDNETNEKFIKMFIEIQEPWKIYKPKNRKSFLSYPYIIYKFCELLEIDHLKDTLKSQLLDDENLKEPDTLWRKICKHLRWEFISIE